MKSKEYVLAIDQSTQGTKAILFDKSGIPCRQFSMPHRQIINDRGWVEHDPTEIFENTLKVCESVLKESNEGTVVLRALGISNQRETTLAWDKETGKPICNAIVWQCARAKDISERHEKNGEGEKIRSVTGIPVSPYFPASKLQWIMENVPEARELEKNKRLAVGTVDSWLIYKLTKDRVHKTDYSNASRTQLFNIKELKWDRDLCEMFSIPEEALPEVCMSDSVFGMTDMCGLSDGEIPICGVAGDSHAALFGHNCRSFGNIKATYGTGSSVMMNTGETPIFNQSGIVTSIAWGVDGTVSYCLEGNLNYTGGVISWLKDDVKLISGAGETEKLAFEAKPEDNTCFVPAFTGLGAPYWNPDVKGMLTGISRTTGKREIVKACLECIGYQINDLIELMREEISAERIELCADGGASANRYLMQFQSDIADVNIKVPEFKELSAMGAAYMAGISAGLYDRDRIFGNVRHVTYTPQISDTMRLEKRKIWKNAVRQALEYKS